MESTTLARRATVTELVRTYEQAVADIRQAFATIATAEVDRVLTTAARIPAGRPWQAVCAAVDTLCSGLDAPASEPAPTSRKFAEQWTDGTPRHVVMVVSPPRNLVWGVHWTPSDGTLTGIHCLPCTTIDDPHARWLVVRPRFPRRP